MKEDDGKIDKEDKRKGISADFEIGCSLGAEKTTPASNERMRDALSQDEEELLEQVEVVLKDRSLVRN